MSASPKYRKIAVVTACMKPDGTPTFVLTEVSVTEDEIENGIHYYLAESELVIAQYEEPFVHFDQNEAPPFLHSAVRNELGLVPLNSEPMTPVLVEAF